MTFKYADWIRLSNAGRWKINRGRRSPALKEVDRWFKQYEDSNYKNKLYLTNLSKAFKTWSNTKQSEETRGDMVEIKLDSVRNKVKDADSGKGAVELLREFIVTQKTADSVVRHETTGLTERVAVVERQANPLTQMEGRKVEEAIKVLQAAIRKSRDTVIGARGPGAARNMYVKWFGAYDENRWKLVRDRFMVLDDICSNKGIVFNDGRNDPMATGAYAWAYPGEERNFPNMWLGNAFFRQNCGTGRARNAYSDTVGTLVHELTHACFNTADVPEEALIGTVAVDQWGSPVDYGNVAVCNDPKNDCRLAERRPVEAIRNADNYGEFLVDVYSEIAFVYQWP